MERLFDLLERTCATADRLAGQRITNHLRAGFARATGGCDVDYLAARLAAALASPFTVYSIGGAMSVKFDVVYDCVKIGGRDGDYHHKNLLTKRRAEGFRLVAAFQDSHQPLEHHLYWTRAVDRVS